MGLLAAMALTAAPRSDASTVLRRLSDFGHGWGGWTAGGGFQLTDTPRQGSTARRHPESGEETTGVLRSAPFVVEGDIIEFLANGWDGRAGGLGLNAYRLRDAATGEALRSASPPLSDAFHKLSWVVSGLKGRRVVFEAVDGDPTRHQQGFAWLGLDAVAEVGLGVPAGKSRMRAVVLEAGGVWQVADYDGAHTKVEPYLSSLALGETATGAVRGPDFRVDVDRISLVLLGHDGPPDGAALGLNYVALLEAGTGRELARVGPPRRDTPTGVVMDTSAARGKTAYLSFVDGDAVGGYAWMGVKEIRVGESVTRFPGPRLPAGWWQGAQEATFAQVMGVPFRVAPAAPRVTADGLRIPIGTSAERIYLCGLVNSMDQGSPVWAPASQTDVRFFLGDGIGSVAVEYEGGGEDVVPLRLGNTAWWWDAPTNQRALDPFAGDPKARGILESSLHLAATGGVQAAAYVLALKPRAGRVIRRIAISDSPAKPGYPLVSGITVDTAADCALERLPHDNPSRAEADRLQRMAVATDKPFPAGDDAALARLRELLYVSDASFTKPLPIEIPHGYRGPKARFSGNPIADVLTNMWYWNIHDMDLKVDSGDSIPGPNWYWPVVPPAARRQSEPGTFHTSTVGAPSWGGYQGFGSYGKGVGAYADHAWSRDYGRIMQELVELGLMDDSAASLAWAFRWAKWWPENRKLPDGSPAPAHWARIINHPDWCITERFPYGNPENDGQALIGLWAYKHWQNAPDPAAWAEANFDDLVRVAEHVVWQMDSPKLSGFDRVLLTDSECSAGVEHGHYADVLCWHMLEGLANIAESIGRTAEAARWRSHGDTLMRGINEVYVERTAEGKPIWTLRNVGWPHQMAAMAAIMALADRTGFDLAAELPAWAVADREAYRRALREQCFPAYSAAPAMGYGQSFLAQCCLLTDEMGDARRCVGNLAKYAYSPLYMPYITPEGCEIDVARGWWHRTGDLGNGVQQGESVKVLRLLLGVDDLTAAHTKLMPRMLRGWKEMSAEGYPVLTIGAGRTVHRKLQYVLRRSGGEYVLRWQTDGPLAKLSVRMGPFSGSVSKGRIDGREVRAEAVKSGDSRWAWFRDVPGTERGEIIAAAVGK
jgi:hypothetical protein